MLKLKAAIARAEKAATTAQTKEEKAELKLLGLVSYFIHWLGCFAKNFQSEF